MIISGIGLICRNVMVMTAGSTGKAKSSGSKKTSHEIGWKVTKNHLEAEGYQNIRSPRDAIKQFFDLGLIRDDTQWLQGLEDRDLTAYTYNNSTADKVILLIRETYYPLMEGRKVLVGKSFIFYTE